MVFDDDTFEKDLQVTMVKYVLFIHMIYQEALLISKLEMEEREQLLVAEVQYQIYWDYILHAFLFVGPF